jgi:tetraacyldisaccharide 4'-kinase
VFSPTTYYDLVSGRRRGPAAAALRGALALVEPCYAAAVRWRNRRFDRGAAAAHRAAAPVISVGNITLGGVGKTPMVRWLLGWFEQRGISAAVVSRGYGSRAGRENDEGLELHRLLPNVPHVQNTDRVAAAREAIERFGCHMLVLDDGFQHRRLARDLDIVLLDALEPFGFGRVFPRGTLREPVEGLRRADVVVLTRADLIDAARREEIWKTVHAHAPAALRAEAVHAPRNLISTAGQQAPLDIVRGRPVAAFCGIGNPAAFRRTLESLGYQIADFREFPDHHRYTPADIKRLAAWAGGLGVSAVLCTCKDLVKLSDGQACSQTRGSSSEGLTGLLAGLPLWAVGIELEFLAGEQSLSERLQSLVANA